MSESQIQAKQPPPVRLLTTGHDDKGISVFTSDDTVKAFHPFPPAHPLGNAATGFTSLHSSPAVPASNTAPPPDLAETLPRVPPRGTYFVVADFPPDYKVPMHRTLSVDYACVLSGEIVLLLDGGDERVVRAGDCILQRGVNHQWLNRTSGFSRVLFVMVGAEPVTLADGAVLEETVFKK